MSRMLHPFSFERVVNAVDKVNERLHRAAGAGDTLADVESRIDRALVTRRVGRSIDARDAPARDAVKIGEVAADVIGQIGLIGRARREQPFGHRINRAVGARACRIFRRDAGRQR